jgi:hypothetical protein
MTSIPISLDNLILYVKSIHEGGTALDALSDAVVVSETLSEQSDALLGHFVDQARRSGASWSQIGASLGVSKQAVQKRFVPPRWGAESSAAGGMFSRFTMRTRQALAAARDAARTTDSDAASPSHIVAGLLAVPEGLAGRALADGGVDPAELAGALGVVVPATPDSPATADELTAIAFDEGSRAVLEDTMKVVLRLGHNYVGTEHLLLGVVYGESAASAALRDRGVTPESVEKRVAEYLAELTGRPKTSGA